MGFVQTGGRAGGQRAGPEEAGPPLYWGEVSSGREGRAGSVEWDAGGPVGRAVGLPFSALLGCSRRSAHPSGRNGKWGLSPAHITWKS